jgi:Membrane bound beta barrel domain (DUF5777)
MRTSIKFIAIAAFLFLGIATRAQKSDSPASDSTVVPKKVKKDFKPVRPAFACGTLLNQQTTQNLKKNTLEFMMQHRFGNFQNGYQDLLGVYGSANIRIGFDYGIIDRVQVGYGVTKNNLTSDFRAKVMILQQSKNNLFPVSISYFGNIGIAGAKDTVQFPKAVDRLSYYHSIIISRRFTDWFSLQVSASYAHYNIIAAAAGTPHDNFDVSGAARFKISPQSSILIEFDYPITNSGTLGKTYNANKSYPNIGLGWEISTGSHAFQIILAASNGILPQANMVYNSNDLAIPKKGLILGFNINRLWTFTGKGKKSKKD